MQVTHSREAAEYGSRIINVGRKGMGIMRNKILIFLLAMIIMILTAACSKPADDTAAQVAPTPEMKKTVEAFGIVEINDVKNINLDFEAVVEAVEVKEGQRVKKDDTLLILNVDNYLNLIRTKEHELNAIRLEMKKLEGRLTEEELENNNDPDIGKLINDLNYANEVLNKALEEQKTQEQLLASGAISQKQYDEFMETVDDKKKNVEDIKYNLDIVLYEKKLNNKEIIDSMAIQRENSAAKENEILQMKSKLKRNYISDNSIVSDVDNGIVYEIGHKPEIGWIRL